MHASSRNVKQRTQELIGTKVRFKWD